MAVWSWPDGLTLKSPPAALLELLDVGRAQGYEAQAQRLRLSRTGIVRRRKGYVAGPVHIMCVSLGDILKDRVRMLLHD